MASRLAVVSVGQNRVTPNRVMLWPMAIDFSGVRSGADEFLPAVAVDLQIDPTRGDPGQTGSAVFAGGQAGQCARPTISISTGAAVA